MRDVRQFVADTIADDPVVKRLIGGTTADNRVYWYYPSIAPVIAPATPAFVVYQFITYPEEQAVGEPILFLTVWSRFIGLSEDVGMRIKALFNKKVLYTGTGRKIYTKIIFQGDAYQENPSYAGKVLHMRIGFPAVTEILMVNVADTISVLDSKV